MKKLLLFLLLITSLSNAQIVNIPNANFKNKLIALGIDTNSDGNIQLSEALAVTSLDISNSALVSVEGIESFTNLTYLNCSKNYINILNVETLTQLTYLNCSENYISILNVGGLNQLTYLNTYYNNYLSSLSVAGLTNLTYLNCARNSLSTLNVSSLVGLTELICFLNSIYILDVTSLVNLTNLDCAGNNISTLNVSNLIHLETIYCGNNDISVLDVSNLSELTILYITNNSISNLNLSSLNNLQELYCDYNNFSNLDLQSLSQLTYLRCNVNPISNLDTSQLVNLNNLICGSAQLLSLDLSYNVNLEYLGIFGGQFTTIDLSNLVNLKGFDAWDGNLVSLDLSNSPLLNGLRMYTSTINYLNIKTGNQINEMNLYNANNIYYVCANAIDIPNLTNQLATINGSYLNISSNCMFFPFGDYNTISGKVSIDTDTNGCDANDFFTPNVRLAMSDGLNQGSTYTDANGIYNFYPQTGSFVVTPALENPSYFNFSPPSYTINLSDTFTDSLVNNFCMSYNGIHKDVEVIILPITTARPGFDAHYQIVYKNKGNQTLSGTIDLDFEDEVMDYISSTVNVDSQTFNTLSWDYTNLVPFETRSFSVVFNLNSPMETPSVNIGDQLDFGVTINPIPSDEVPDDNTLGLKQFVVGSVDPNDKACLEGNVVSTSKIGDYLHYTINFENVGNAPATFVVVKDEIDSAKFDVNSLQIMYASHPMVTRVAGNKVEFIFDDINLGPNQHGNVTFKIKTKSTLVAGNTVTNKANIYFDYNFPIETNTTSTTFQTLSNEEFPTDYSVVIAPNPTKNSINVNCNSNIQSIQLFDVQGRVLMTQLANNSQSTVDVSNYTNGIYFVKVLTGEGNKVEKIIKE